MITCYRKPERAFFALFIDYLHDYSGLHSRIGVHEKDI